MKQIFSLIILSAIALAAFSQSKDVDDLKKLNEAWIGSYPKKDTATLNRILANDFIIITPAGTKLSKGQLLNNTISSPITAASVDTVEVRLISETVALVIAKASFKYMDEGKEGTGQTNYMDVYEKRNGKWVAVAAHVTSLK